MNNWPAFNEAYAYTGGAGMIGRLMFHSRQVQMGKRKPFSLALIMDLPIALGMGWTALGMAKFLGFAPEPTTSLAIAAAYLGPYSVDRLFIAFTDRYLKKSEEPTIQAPPGETK